MIAKVKPDLQLFEHPWWLRTSYRRREKVIADVSYGSQKFYPNAPNLYQEPVNLSFEI